MSINTAKIKAQLSTHNVVTGLPGWYGITDTDPTDPKKKLPEFRKLERVGVLGAMGLTGKPGKLDKSSSVAPWIADGLSNFGLTPSEATEFAAGYDGLPARDGGGQTAAAAAYQAGVACR